MSTSVLCHNRERSTEPTDLIERLVESLKTRNAPAFASLFADEVEFVTIFGNRMRGRNAISAGHHMVFETVLAGTLMKATGVDVMPLGDDVAMMHAE